MPNRSVLWCAVLLFARALPTLATPLTGQPVPAPAAIATAQPLVTGITSATGDNARLRPQLLTLVDANPVADWGETLAPALKDGNTFTALVATFDDALDAESDAAKQAFIRYNLLRVLIARAALLETRDRRTVLVRAAELAESLAKSNRGDAGVWEATGDLYALKSDPVTAAAAFKRMASVGDAAKAWRKTGDAYVAVRNYGQARAAYETGIRADASANGGKRNRHLLYQSLASLYLAQGQLNAAADALLLSARVKPDADAPYTFRLDVADALLKRGLNKPVREYATLAVAFAPDDAGAARLLVQATGAK